MKSRDLVDIIKGLQYEGADGKWVFGDLMIEVDIERVILEMGAAAARSESREAVRDERFVKATWLPRVDP